MNLILAPAVPLHFEGVSCLIQLADSFSCQLLGPAAARRCANHDELESTGWMLVGTNLLTAAGAMTIVIL